MLGFTCDVCGREVQGITFVNGMKFCAKCYQEIFGNYYTQEDIINAQVHQYLRQENEKLKREKEQLKEQNEELKDQSKIWQKLLFEKMETQIIGVTKEKMQQILHEICEKIRTQFDNECYLCYGDNNKTIVIDENDFNIILNQIKIEEE